MNPTDPRHGSYAGYLAHHRAGEHPCPPCRVAARRANKARRLDIIQGNPRLVPLGDDAYRIVTTIPPAVITVQTGIHAGKLLAYANGGPDKLVRRSTRDRLLTVEAWTYDGVRRRLRALACNGWSMRALAPEVGVGEDTLKRICNNEGSFVRQQVAAPIVDHYDRLSMTKPQGRGATRARNAAARAGWLPPLAWDDIDHDPTPTGVLYRPDRRKTEVDEAAVLRAMAGDRTLDLTRAERFEVVNRLRNRGWSLLDIEARTVITKADRYLTPDDQDGEAA